MFAWDEYVEQLIKTPTVLDNINLSINGQTMSISPIVKASIQMLENMIAAEGPYNIFVLPEMKCLGFEFVLSKVIFNIMAGKIQMSYDPKDFVPGQRLKYKGCVMEFDHIETTNGRECIFVRFADLKYGVPISIAPYLQITDAKRLSKYERFANVFSANDAILAATQPVSSKTIEETLSNYKTHLDGSVFYVSNIKSAKDFLSTCNINDKALSDALLIGHANSDGEISNVFAGQLSGNPAIVLASDLYSVVNAAQQGAKIQSIIVDVSQSNIIESQLSLFDDLSQFGFPIACITNTSNSFGLKLLTDRGYNLWRWDSKSISTSIRTSQNQDVCNRISNCANQKVNYVSLVSSEINTAVKYLYAHKNEIEDKSSTVISVYEKLFSLAFVVLRNVVPLSVEDIHRFNDILTECETLLEDEKRFLSPELYSDLITVTNKFKVVLSSKYVNVKAEKIAELITSEEYHSLCIVIPDKLNKDYCYRYWQGVVLQNNLDVELSIMYPQEYKNATDISFDATVIVGWLNNKIMRDVIYSFVSPEYIVLTYTCEDGWKKAHTKQWSASLKHSSNRTLVKTAFSKNKIEISLDIFEEPEDVVVEEKDELEDIELLIQRSKYQQYSSQNINELTDAYPVSFVGGSLAFYRLGHKVVTVTEIITGDSDNIKQKYPEELCSGDFVVVRESSRDVIRDLADKILQKHDLSDLREVANKWKEALSIESVFSSPEQIHRKLKAVGCTKDLVTIRNWLTNDELITPQSKDDLGYIAQVTGDAVLSEKIDEIHEAGKKIKVVHGQAGRLLSNRLKIQIAEKIQEYGNIDPYNIWDPIALQIEDIGTVKILKVIDIGSVVPVDTSNTNRLLND